MNYRIILCLIGFMINGCTAAGPIPTAALTPSSIPSPTITSTLTSASTPSPTITFTPSPVSLPAGREIIFDESVNRNFTGTAYGEGETAIILANMSIGGEKQWDPFVAAVDKQKFTAVTFN